MKAFKLFAAMFMALSSMVFVSCGSDNEEGSFQEENIIENLMANKWSTTVYDVDLLKQETYVLYFIDESHGVEFCRSRFLDISGSTSEESIPFTYYVEDNIVYISIDGSTSTYISYIYTGDYLIWGEQEVYEPHSWTSSDYEYVKDYDPVEIAKKEQIAKDIRASVKFTKSYDTYTCTYNFTSTLKEKYSPSDFKYGVEFGDGSYDWQCVHEDSSSSSFSIMLYLTGDDGSAPGMYLQSLTSLEDKKARGETLTSEEWDFYYQLKALLKDMLADNFCSRAFVELNGDKYYLE